ncbi:NAD(P)-dependent oxidoreductase [Cupriavidus basilensis]
MLVGMDVYGSTLGILGMGRIGQALARRAAGFGMNVLYHNRSQLPEATERALNARYVSKGRIAAAVGPPGAGAAIRARQPSCHRRRRTESDEADRHAGQPARGGIVDDEALAHALKTRRIFAAGLDVFEGEPDVHPDLLTVSNVVLTPHIASASEKTCRAMAMLAADNLIAALDAGPDAGHPPSVINPAVMGHRR